VRRRRSSASRACRSSSASSSRWSTRTTRSSTRPTAAATLCVCCRSSTARSSSPRPRWRCTAAATMSRRWSTSCRPRPTHRFSCCRPARSPTSSTRTSAASTFRSKRSVRQSSCRSRTLSSTNRLVSTRRVACSCTVLQAPARRTSLDTRSLSLARAPVLYRYHSLSLSLTTTRSM